MWKLVVGASSTPAPPSKGADAQVCNNQPCHYQSQSAWQHTHLCMRLCAAASECLQFQLIRAQVGHVLQQGRVEWMISAACILTTGGHTPTGRHKTLQLVRPETQGWMMSPAEMVARDTQTCNKEHQTACHPNSGAARWPPMVAAHNGKPCIADQRKRQDANTA